MIALAKQDSNAKTGGLGPCDNPKVWGDHWICGCAGVCATCGNKKHTGVHMHCAGGKPGDRPWGHVFKEAP